MMNDSFENSDGINCILEYYLKGIYLLLSSTFLNKIVINVTFVREVSSK